MNADNTALDRDLALLTETLDRAVRGLSGEHALALLHELRELAEAVRAGDRGASRARSRSGSTWRTPPRRCTGSGSCAANDGDNPARHSLAKAADLMRGEGLSAADVHAQVERLFVMPVLTAASRTYEAAIPLVGGQGAAARGFWVGVQAARSRGEGLLKSARCSLAVANRRQRNRHAQRSGGCRRARRWSVSVSRVRGRGPDAAAS
jgi:hypothetical protein